MGMMFAVVRVVFAFEGNDLSVHPSLEAAASHVKAIDVNTDVYDFFTEDGTLLRAHAKGQEVALRPTAERRPDELRERLASYLSHPRFGLDANLADDPVAAARTILESAWSVRPFRWFPWPDKRLNGATPPRVV
jgi:hypothetical protein